MEKEVISFRGERDKWLDFVHELRKDKKEVWDVLSDFINKYLKSKK